jgi:hypothetical protein
MCSTCKSPGVLISADLPAILAYMHASAPCESVIVEAPAECGHYLVHNGETFAVYATTPAAAVRPVRTCRARTKRQIRAVRPCREHTATRHCNYGNTA